MIQYKSSAQLKANARGQLLGKYGVYVPAILIMQVIISILTNIIRAVSDPYTLPGMIIYFLLFLVTLLISCIFSIGSARMGLQVSCNRSIVVSDIFYGFSHHLDKNILITLRLFAYIIIPVVITGSVPVALAFTGNIWLIILGFIVMFAGFITAFYFSLRYALIYFILLDFPQYSISQIFQMSDYLMKGQKAKLLYVMCSFIPLGLLSILSFGLARLWITPYYNVTITNFYCNLVKVAASRQVIHE